MTLLEELTNDPLSRGYAQMTNAEVEVSLNTKDRTRLTETLIGFGTVLDVLGPADGAVVLDALEAAKAVNRPLFWAWVLLEQGRLDLGKASVQAQLDVLAGAGLMTSVQATALKNLAIASCNRAEELGVVANDYTIRAARG